ncbi:MULTISPECIES: helix-turn-helix domain-containing protein [Mesonia]|uniref:Exoenzyme S synthesis regulatory protein ExsA n=1 Tax=Mesonia oceanica TaxID=2687242 RepID=A0AC61Y692_9FLAO|nr:MULTISPECIES: AraC family transcriptional regulator [Mesonia]MAN27338.1 AraC family transcriptional regulator [Mesonia sp.]MAQ42269.1 AraC family transcriptional regulator [Mesonia sp.]MBJ98555.1 AraC family transcriptional regulator [Flavobacteriaceae bacterium]VVV00029.1 Exoenzyme S synthesis regulatory protein ExsA [Mesonia oceanica]|tara:strand:- start:136 stop:978 length:843 start_codon:yes stop_codon:yes gene_type:complete
MLVDNIPDIFIPEIENSPEILVHDFRMTTDNVKSKVNLRMHMFSFLQIGKKEVHFAETSVRVDKNQSILTTKGNCLWTELLDTENSYYCKLFFFSEKVLKDFLKKHPISSKERAQENPFFIIENDNFISAFIDSLSAIGNNQLHQNESLIKVKFEEILLYLSGKYGNQFSSFLQSLIQEKNSTFRDVVERHVYSNLKVEEIAFLCNMSLSTFKRHFKEEFQASPGKWLLDQRLEKAKILMEQRDVKASEVYLEIGYNNLSNFSTAFKNKFGISPKELSCN